MRIYTNPRLVEQYRFPRTHKRRIRKKWSSRKQNYRPSLKLCYVGRDHAGEFFVCHPAVARAFKDLERTYDSVMFQNDKDHRPFVLERSSPCQRQFPTRNTSAFA